MKKHLTEEKGWVPAQYLLNEVHYTHYLQRKLHEKIDKLPVFESMSYFIYAYIKKIYLKKTILKIFLSFF